LKQRGSVNTIVPDYAHKSVPVPRLSRLAVLALIASVIAAPPFIHVTHGVIKIPIGVARLLIFTAPLLSVCLTLGALIRLRSHSWLTGRALAITALIINVLAIAVYGLIILLFMTMGGPD